MIDADDTEHPDDEDDGVSRRWLVRLLVGLGIGIPVLVEGTTFLGLVWSGLFDGDGNEDTATTTQQATGVGGELLPETTPRETLADAVVKVGKPTWRFEVTVTVENAGGVPYTFRLVSMTTDAGTRIGATGSTGQIPPGESRGIEDAWTFPTNEYPETLTCVGVSHTASGDERTTETIRLGDIPLQG